MSQLSNVDATDSLDRSQVVIGDKDNQTYANVSTRSDGKTALCVDQKENITVILNRSQVFGFIHASTWMSVAEYDDVSISVTGTIATLTYKQDNGILGKATVDFTSADVWSMTLDRYITEEDNNPLMDDDDSNLNLD